MTQTHFSLDFQPKSWGLYQKAGFKGQIASSLVVLISAVAFTIIATASPDAISLPGNFPIFATLVGVGSAGLITFIISSVIHYLGNREIKEDLLVLAERAKTVEEAPKTTPSNISHILTVLVNPLIDSFRDAFGSIVDLHGAKKGIQATDRETTLKKVNDTFTSFKTLMGKIANDHQLLITELLRYFGRGRISKTYALRRYVVAQNSGDQEIIQEAKEHYEAICRGHNLEKLHNALKSTPTATLMNSLPTLLSQHFSFPDEELKTIGVEVLREMFTRTQNNSKVRTALESLKKRNYSSTFVKEVEDFIMLVQQEAKLTQRDYAAWSTHLVDHYLEHHFKKFICRILNLIASNVSLLKHLFKSGNQETNEAKPLNAKEIEEKRQKEILQIIINLNQTDLFSDSNDCISDFVLQDNLFALQSEMNIGRDREARIAFIVLPEDDKRDIDTLIQEIDVIKQCFENNKYVTQLTEEERVRVSAFNQEHHVKLVAVPLSIPDHVFKFFIDWDTYIRSFANAVEAVATKPLKWVLKTFIKPEILSIFPKLCPADNKELEKIFDTLIDLFVSPLLAGAMHVLPKEPDQQSFVYLFQTIITTQGASLNLAINKLITQGHEKITFEKIAKVSTTAVKALSTDFKKPLTPAK